ncbi:MAG: hypothetical protein JRF71_11370 [Deltaproteobacteria bacterium]|nr:hypothetical protein [Deltaproteobacteria bacterium]MBW2201411.1 hypothetical protein [Deltaproteobacteria bacterium]
MHDVHRDSLIYKKDRKGKGKQQGHSHSQGDEHKHEHAGSHSHDHSGHDHEAHTQEDTHDQHHGHDDGHKHEHGNKHDHDHEVPNGHDHRHDESAYDGHDRDIHLHGRDQKGHENFEDRAFSHVHEHGHNFYHSHHHAHEPEHATITHKIFKDPVRDWFALFLMGILISAGYLKWLPGRLSEGMIVCAAVIGIFPVVKNALFDCIASKKLNFELLLGILLAVGLFSGSFLPVALISFFLLVGSFLRLNFSWRNE